MHPLPLVLLIIGLFLASALALTGLIVADRLAERRLNPPKRDATPSSSWRRASSRFFLY